MLLAHNRPRLQRQRRQPCIMHVSVSACVFACCPSLHPLDEQKSLWAPRLQLAWFTIFSLTAGLVFKTTTIVGGVHACLCVCRLSMFLSPGRTSHCRFQGCNWPGLPSSRLQPASSTTTTTTVIVFMHVSSSVCLQVVHFSITWENKSLSAPRAQLAWFGCLSLGYSQFHLTYPVTEQQ